MKERCYRVVLLGCLLIASTCKLDAHAPQQPAQRSLSQWEDSLQNLGQRIYHAQSEPERLKANFTFVKTLVSALQTPFSYDYAFSGLDMISIQVSPDGQCKVFSWHVGLSDGSYLYYGAIQLPDAQGKLRLIPLLDKTYEIRQPESAVTSASNWYGAQYYDIIPYGKHYLLLGWKGHNKQITQKLIEVLTLDEAQDTVMLGAELFDGSEYTGKTRIIYQFRAGISMHLSYQQEDNRIVADHLVPAEPNFKGVYEHYGPDMTFDAWILNPNKLRLKKGVTYKKLF